MCNICGQVPCTNRCPNHIPPQPRFICDYCLEGIYPGDEYIENPYNQYIHTDCFRGFYDLVKWLGFEIRTLEEE